LQSAFITAPDSISDEQKEKLKPITGRYFD